MWLHGLGSAAITGLSTSFLSSLGISGANACGVQVSQLDLRQMVILTVIGGLVGGAAYLQKSPLPEEPTVTPPSIKLSLLLLPFLIFTQGCTTTQTSMIDDALPAIPTVVNVAGTLAMNLAIKDDAERQAVSNEMYAVASAVRTLMNGTAPTPDKVTEICYAFGGKDPKLQGVIEAIGSIWDAYYPSIKGDPATAMKILEAIAEGSEKAAKNVMNVK